MLCPYLSPDFCLYSFCHLYLHRHNNRYRFMLRYIKPYHTVFVVWRIYYRALAPRCSLSPVAFLHMAFCARDREHIGFIQRAYRVECSIKAWLPVISLTNVRHDLINVRVTSPILIMHLNALYRAVIPRLAVVFQDMHAVPV